MEKIPEVVLSMTGPPVVFGTLRPEVVKSGAVNPQPDATVVPSAKLKMAIGERLAMFAVNIKFR